MSRDEISKEELRILESIVVGDLEADAPGVIELSQASEAFRIRLLDLQQVKLDLTATGALQRAAVTESENINAAPGEDVILATLGLDTERGGKSRLPWRWISAAAAAIVLATIALQLPPNGMEEPVIPMGSGLRLTVEESGVLRWSLDRGAVPGVEYSVTVRSAGDSTPIPAPHQFVTQKTQWQLSGDIRERFSGRFWVDITARLDTGFELAQSSVLFDTSLR